MVFEQKFAFSLVVFLFTCGILTLIFIVFFCLLSDSFLNGFPNAFLVRSRSSLLLSR